MKIKKSVRLNESVIKAVNRYAKANGMNFSQVVESSILSNKKLGAVSDEKEPLGSKNKFKNVWLDEKTLTELIKVAQAKNITVTEEIRFRLSSSLSMPCFDTLELHELEQVKININQIGRLINMAICEKLIVDNEKIR